jgi:hypothetical protein
MKRNNNPKTRKDKPKLREVKSRSQRQIPFKMTIIDQNGKQNTKPLSIKIFEVKETTDGEKTLAYYVDSDSLYQILLSNPEKEECKRLYRDCTKLVNVDTGDSLVTCLLDEDTIVLLQKGKNLKKMLSKYKLPRELIETLIRALRNQTYLLPKETYTIEYTIRLSSSNNKKVRSPFYYT